MYIIVYIETSKNLANMIVISSAELRANLKKYLDLAATERVIIQRGKNEVFNLSCEEWLEPDDDLANAMTGEEFLQRMIQSIHEMYKLPR